MIFTGLVRDVAPNYYIMDVQLNCSWGTEATSISLCEGMSIGLPAVVTTDLRLNEPRYATLPNIMKAKKKPLETVKPADLGVDVAPRLATLKVSEPAQRKAGEMVADVAQLVDKLKNVSKVI